MRLIAGFLHLDGRPADPSRLHAMAAAMTEAGLYPRVEAQVDGPVALLTLDFGPEPSGEGSPVHDHGVILAADARLDEPDTIRGDAGLAALLAERGAAGLGVLAGDFALAAWNRRDLRLLCARDTFGVRPFFFAHRPDDLFVFASLPRGLHASGLLAREVDQDFLVGEMLFQFDGPERSLFQGVQRLAPGSWLELTPDGPVRSGRHWSLDPASVGSLRINPVDAAAEMSRLMAAAVHRRLPVTGPVAAHLSGGLDSSAIAIIAARALHPAGRRLLAYSHAPNPFGDYRFGGDGAYLAPVLQQEPDIDWHPIRTVDSAAFALPVMDRDQLFPADPSYRDSQTLSHASRSGASVLLSGWGGDEAASYGWRGVLAEALVAGHWAYLASELRALGSVGAVWGALSPFLLPDGLRVLSERALGRANPAPRIAELAAELLRPEQLADRCLTPPVRHGQARQIRLSLLSGHGLTRRAEHWAILAARHGMSVSFPMLDRRLVEFALSLPSTLFVREGWSRRVFRDAMAGILPEPLRWKRTKLDLVVEDPVHVAAQRLPLTERLALWRQHDAITDLFDLDAVAARLASLPVAEDLARTIDTGQGDWTAIDQAGSLTRAFRVMSYLEQHG
jgi:asparagine synthase (glutamine-hydrolysing)